MRKSYLILAVLILLVCSIPVTALTMQNKEFNKPTTSMKKIVMIQFTILPPIRGAAVNNYVDAISFNTAQNRFKFYKDNAQLYNELLGEKLRVLSVTR